MQVEEFKSLCNFKKCLRHTMYTTNCSKEWKQEQCFKKWDILQTKTKQQIDDAIKQSNDQWQIREQQKLDGTYEPKEFPLNEEYEQFKKDVWNTYAGFYDGNVSNRNDWKSVCMFWNCLTKEEKIQCDELNKKEYFLNRNIDIAHILGKGESPKNKYDIDNVVLIGRLWHSRLDTYKHPITNEPISKFERMDWFIRIKNSL